MYKKNKYRHSSLTLWVKNLSLCRYGVGLLSVGFLSVSAHSHNVEMVWTASPIINTMSILEDYDTPVFQETITGIVLDADGLPLAGANIVEKGTSNGTQTDFDGNFSLEVASGKAVLVVSYIGYNTTEVSLEGKTNIEIVLEENAAGLNEVVVVGYASKTKGELTGSVFKLENDQLESRPQSNVFESLQGAIPGLQIVNGGGGKVGTDVPFIRLRGISSTTGDGAGILIVIDGIVQPENNGNALNQLNPDDIENITVLKDAQAAIYGARAAGGVLLVTTKRGITSKPTIEYSTNVSVNALGNTSICIWRHMPMMVSKIIFIPI